MDEWVGSLAELAGDNVRNARSAFIFRSAPLSLSNPPPLILPALSLPVCLFHCPSLSLFYLFAGLSVSVFLSVVHNISAALAMTINGHVCLWSAQVGGYGSGPLQPLFKC